MNGTETRAYALLEKEPLLRVMALEWMRAGRGKVLACVPGGALVLDTQSGVPMLCADNVDIALSLLGALPRPADVLVCDLAEADAAVMERLHFKGRIVFHNYVYPFDAPLPEDPAVRLLPMPDENTERVSRHYDIHTPEELRGFIREGTLLGGYAGDAWVGFIGWHEEGSMGMLHVFEQYRRRGYGRAMEARLTNLTLQMGRRPYGQVLPDNHVSAWLQRSLGFVRSEKTVSWLFAEEDWKDMRREDEKERP